MPNLLLPLFVANSDLTGTRHSNYLIISRIAKKLYRLCFLLVITHMIILVLLFYFLSL